MQNYYYSKYTDFIGYKVGVKFNTLQDDTSTGAYEISLPSIQETIEWPPILKIL